MSAKSFPAPVRGLVLNESLSAAGPAAARQLDNWFPTSSGIRVRGGSKNWQRVATSSPVLSLWSYKTGALEKFFAATETSIFDISNPTTPNVVPTPVVTGRTSGNYSVAQFSTSGGEFLYAVNGTDKPLLYDGTTWTPIDGASTPAITGVSTSTFSHVWVYANRLFFVQNNSLVAWYLPVDSLGGAALDVSMAGVFQKGGKLLLGSRWSMDAGDGLDDKCVFMSSEGETAVYQGTNPASPADWQKAGVYEMTAPMGPKAVMQAGGDLLVAVEDGVVPISAAIERDTAALSLSAVSKPIEPLWNESVVARRGLPWEILKWPSANMMVVSQPVTTPAQRAVCLVANIETGAWARYTEWNTRCLGLYTNRGFFGTDDGRVMQMETGGSDDGVFYVATYVGQFETMGVGGSIKTVKQARSNFIASSPFTPQTSVSTNYSIDLPTAPSPVADYVAPEWDSALWDSATWDAAGAPSAFTSNWSSVGRTGYSIAPQVQITCATTPLPRIELVAVDVTFEAGGLVV